MPGHDELMEAVGRRTHIASAAQSGRLDGLDSHGIGGAVLIAPTRH